MTQKRYDIGDVVLINQSRHDGDYYKSLNGVGIIIGLYNADYAVGGYTVVVAGKMNEKYFIVDRDIARKLE